MNSLDSSVTDWVLRHRTPPLNAMMRAATSLAGFPAVFIVVGVSALILVRRGDRRLALLIVVSSAGTWLLVNGTKLAVQRPRPPMVDRLVSARGYSFPSGHAGQGVAVYFGLAVVIWCCSQRRWVRATAVFTGGLLAVTIGASRVYLGVHWTTDVLAGWMIALGWLALVSWVVAPRSLRPAGSSTESDR